MFWLIVCIVVVAFIGAGIAYDRRYPGVKITRRRPRGKLLEGMVRAEQADEQRHEQESHQGQP